MTCCINLNLRHSSRQRLRNDMALPTKEQISALPTFTPAGRRTIFADPRNFLLFFDYYFLDFIRYPHPQFHDTLAQDFADLVDGTITELIWVTARETAKSSFERGMILWLIANGRAHYINQTSYDRENSEGVLYDVVVEMQTNARFIQDYGQIFNSNRNRNEEKQSKRTGNFVTEGNVRVEAHTVAEPVRGRLHDGYRPDWSFNDDIENMKTVQSEANTREIRNYLSEMRGGLDQKNARTVFFGNWQSDDGIMAMLKEKAKLNPKSRYREVWRVDKVTGLPTWPERDVLTDAELLLPGNEQKVSIETKMREMRAADTGDNEYLREYQGEIVDLANARFRSEMFRKISLKDVLSQSPLNCFVTVDTPSKKEGLENDGKDRCGICVNFVNAAGDWHVMARGEYYGPTATVEEMVRLWSYLTDECGVTPSVMAWEDTAYTRALEPLLKIEKDRHKVFFPITWLKHQGRAKSDRIRSGLLHRYETGRIWHIEGHCDDLEVEARRFPNGAHDDVLDAVAYQSDVVRLPKDIRSMRRTERRFYEVMREKRVRERKGVSSLRMA